MTEQWIKWEPIQGLAGQYDLEFISDDMKKDGKCIVILAEYKNGKNGNKGLRITWEKNPVWAFRVTDESFRQKLINDLSEKHGSEFYVHWTFFKVENSEYLKWLSEQSCEVTDYLKFQHFSILGIESFVDIVSWSEPKFEFIDL